LSHIDVVDTTILAEIFSHSPSAVRRPGVLRVLSVSDVVLEHRFLVPGTFSAQTLCYRHYWRTDRIIGVGI
jgi:hypothetical protein